MPVFRSLRNTTRIAGGVVSGVRHRQSDVAEDARGGQRRCQIRKKLVQYRLLLATGVASLVLTGVGCSREAPGTASRQRHNRPGASRRVRTPSRTRACSAVGCQVPEDRSKPGGRRIELNVTVVRASATPRQPDPIFHFAGGPSDTGDKVGADLGGAAVRAQSRPCVRRPTRHARVRVSLLRRPRRPGGSHDAAISSASGRSVPRSLGPSSGSDASTRPSRRLKTLTR